MRNTPLLVVCGALLSLVACASAPPPPPVPDVAEVCAADVQPPVPRLGQAPNIQAPVVVHRVAPRTDRALIGNYAQATVEAVIGEDGVPRNVCFVSGDRNFGRALVQAVRQWRFRPAVSDGKPVAVIFQVTTTFRG